MFARRICLFLLVASVVGSAAVAGERATRRAALLKGPFEMTLEYHGPRKGMYINLWFYNGPARPSPPLPPPWVSPGANKKQVEAIVRFLGEDGFLDRAVDIRGKYDFPPPRLADGLDGPCYVVAAFCGKEVLYENLGWGRGMLGRLEKLRRALTGRAAEAMDVLLDRLEPHRKMWSPAATRPAGRIDWRKAGTYRSGPWEYRHELSVDRTKQVIGRWGHLHYRGKPLRAPEVNDSLRTPWGVLFDVGAGQTPSGLHGWMDRPGNRSKRKGKLLPSPMDAVRFQALDPRRRSTFLMLYEIGYRDGKFRPRLMLSGPDRKPGKPQDGFAEVRLSDRQMHSLLKRLAYSGWLGKTADLAFVHPLSPAYIAYVADGGHKYYYRNLGWLPGMLTELPALRAALEGDAVTEMDKLLARLADVRKRWQAVTASPPATLEAIGKDLGDLIGMRWTIINHDPPIGRVLWGNLRRGGRGMPCAILPAGPARVRQYVKMQRARGVRLSPLGASAQFTVLAGHTGWEEAVSQALMAALKLRKLPATQPAEPKPYKKPTATP